MQRVVIRCLSCLDVTIARAATLDRVHESRVFRIGYRADANAFATSGANPLATSSTSAARSPQPSPRRSNVQVTYVLVPADQRFEAVRDGKVDILCDPSSVTLARREMVDFSLPTFLDGAAYSTV
jgi:ABC-type amino acid transport substrate-binding protein